VFKSNAIAYYVNNVELQGSTPEAAAQVVQWVSFADSDIVPPASTEANSGVAGCSLEDEDFSGGQTSDTG
jgi:hypothetical protein